MEDFNKDGVAQGVVDLIAGLAGGDDLFGAKDGEVLGGVGLVNAEFGDELASGFFAVAEGFDDGDAGGVGEGLEDLRFEFSELAFHNFSIFVLSNIRNVCMTGVFGCWMGQEREFGGERAQAGDRGAWLFDAMMSLCGRQLISTRWPLLFCVIWRRQASGVVGGWRAT